MSKTTDLDVIGAIIAALYEIISGPAGQAPDWSRERRLFHPSARLTRTGFDDGRNWALAMSLDEYIENTREFLTENDFFEIEVARQEQRFGNVASVRSVYEARAHPDDPTPIKRGVNFIHLYHDGNRWWIMNILWDNERDGLEIPTAWLSS